MPPTFVVHQIVVKHHYWLEYVLWNWDFLKHGSKRAKWTNFEIDIYDLGYLKGFFDDLVEVYEFERWYVRSHLSQWWNKSFFVKEDAILSKMTIYLSNC